MQRAGATRVCAMLTMVFPIDCGSRPHRSCFLGNANGWRESRTLMRSVYAKLPRPFCALACFSRTVTYAPSDRASGQRHCAAGRDGAIVGVAISVRPSVRIHQPAQRFPPIIDGATRYMRGMNFSALPQPINPTRCSSQARADRSRHTYSATLSPYLYGPRYDPSDCATPAISGHRTTAASLQPSVRHRRAKRLGHMAPLAGCRAAMSSCDDWRRTRNANAGALAHQFPQVVCRPDPRGVLATSALPCGFLWID